MDAVLTTQPQKQINMEVIVHLINPRADVPELSMDAVLITQPQKQINLEAIVLLILHQHQLQLQLQHHHVQLPSTDAVLIIPLQKLTNQEVIVLLIHQPPEDVLELFMDAVLTTQPQKINMEAIVHHIHPYKLIKMLFLLLHPYNLIQMLFLYLILFLQIHQRAQNLNHALHVEDVLNHPLIAEKYPIMPVQIQNIYPFLF
jgi:hypothetical protein